MTTKSMFKKLGLVILFITFTYITIRYIIPSHNLNPLRKHIDKDKAKQLKPPTLLQAFHANYPNLYFVLFLLYYIMYVSFIIFMSSYLTLGRTDFFEFRLILAISIIMTILLFMYFNLPTISWGFYYLYFIIMFALYTIFGFFFLYFIWVQISGFISGKFPNLADVLRLGPKVFICDIKSVYKQLKEGSIPFSIVYLLIFQILIISLYFLYPNMKQSLQFRSSTVLLDKPIYLNYKKQIGSSLNIEKTHLNSFGLTFDFFLHQTGEMFESSNEKDILQYDTFPRITYDTFDGIFRIYLKRGTKGISLCNQDTYIKVYEDENIPLQQWHNITINYDHGILDIFMNHKLIITRRDLIPCVHEPIITVGDDHGLEGGIKNVRYYNNPISNI